MKFRSLFCFIAITVVVQGQSHESDHEAFSKSEDIAPTVNQEESDQETAATLGNYCQLFWCGYRSYYSYPRIYSGGYGGYRNYGSYGNFRPIGGSRIYLPFYGRGSSSSSYVPPPPVPVIPHIDPPHIPVPPRIEPPHIPVIPHINPPHIPEPPRIG